ncbi:MAG: hypothetical protein IJM92_13615, partial [Fibrobacter sp.]|uniref:hypothetical protein n=1 Tax=Fibrobacter sp. TaxID=35828 RepID=UPI0025C5D8CC
SMPQGECCIHTCMNITEPFSMTQSVNAATILVWSWLSRKVGACARMGRVQGGKCVIFAYAKIHTILIA